jgi:hypothetical protein
MPYKLRDQSRHKFSKARYKIKNWQHYEAALKNRGNICFWFSNDAICKWYSSNLMTQGRQQKYSDLAIETGLIIKTVFKLPYRALEGFLNSICQLMKITLDIPDHTSFSRRAKSLKLSKLLTISTKKSLNIIIDSTGLKVLGPNEWQDFKHKSGKRKSWRKLHLMIDEQYQQIVASELTEDNISDDAMVGPLLKTISNPIKSFKADRAYDTNKVYKDIETFSEHRCPKIIIPPRPNAKRVCLYKIYLNKREKLTRHWFCQGPYRWQKETGYNKRSLVETAMMRYKKLIGSHLYSRDLSTQNTESRIGCLVLNRMLSLGKPVSIKA